MQNNTLKKTQNGFIQFIIIVIVAVILLSILGYNPEVIWQQYALPILNWFWNLFISILNFIVSAVAQLFN